MYAVSFIYYNLILHCFPFLSFYGKFCLSPRTMEFFTVTTVDNWLFHQTYRFPYHPRVWPVVQIAVTIGNSIRSLRIFTIWRVSGWQRSMRKPPQMRIQNGPPFIIDCSSPGRVLREGVFHKFSDIYTPHPKTAPDMGMLNIYFLSRQTLQCWGVRPCPSDPRLGVGGCCVFSWTFTLRHGDRTPHWRRFCILHVEHPRLVPPLKKRQLGTCMCFDDVYVKTIIILYLNTDKDIV